MSAYKNIKNETSDIISSSKKLDVFHAMKSFFEKEEAKQNA